MLGRTTTALRGIVDRLRAGGDDETAPRAPTRHLDPATRRALGLRHQPFRDDAGADELFRDHAIEMQINMLAEQLRSGEMLPILKGEPGSGKTSMLIQLMAQHQRGFHFFVCRGRPGLAAERILADMLRLLTRPIPDDFGDCFRQLAQRLRGIATADSPAALVVDDAQLLSDADLGHLLVAVDSLRKFLRGHFRLLLAADPAIELRLPALTSEQIDAGHVVTAGIRPLTRPRIAPYLDWRLTAAGAPPGAGLDDDALDRIAAAGGNLPRSLETAAAAELNARWGADS